MTLNRILILLLLVTFGSGCEDFVTVKLPDSLIGTEIVFEDDQTARAAANAMYRAMQGTTGFIGGTLANVNYMTAMSGDEMVSYSATDALREFYLNALNTNNTNVLRIWSSAYNTLYEANAVIAGVTQSSGLSAALKDQLLGEAYFVRAFCHFYLVNLYGNVPLATTTDYRINASVARIEADVVYEHILEDLARADQLLTDNTKVLPGKSAVTALRARVYLYQEEYELAEAHATDVIENPVFSLQQLNNVFLTGSSEAIWQLAQITPTNLSTGDAALFTITGNSYVNSLTPDLVSAFEPGDQRRTSWVRQWNGPSGTVHYAAKYKVRTSPSSTVFTEQLVVFRLAEQYLIRAEARTHRDNLAGAIADLDVIRARAGLPLIAETHPDISKDDLIARIEHERRIELFCETAHRWLDLKRTGRIEPVLSLKKPGWSAGDALYPLPETELLANPRLAPQNPGY